MNYCNIALISRAQSPSQCFEMKIKGNSMLNYTLSSQIKEIKKKSNKTKM